MGYTKSSQKRYHIGFRMVAHLIFCTYSTGLYIRGHLMFQVSVYQYLIQSKVVHFIGFFESCKLERTNIQFQKEQGRKMSGAMYWWLVDLNYTVYCWTSQRNGGIKRRFAPMPMIWTEMVNLHALSK